MKKNVGSIDKVVRIILAAVLVGLLFAKVVTGTLAIVAVIVGAILLLTSAVSFCPLYSVLGLTSRKKETLSKS
ncbi:MAG TPA: DUF2892 domain-containing protein [Bacteroidales bacterium]|nr:DUF2892 domain-containing protein [Bacteroidales bacterium]